MELLDLGKLKSYRFQVINITVATGSTANAAYEANVQLDRDYNKVIGIGFFEVADGGIADNYNVGARTQRQTWLDPININAWQADSGVGPNEKYYKVEIPYGSGDTFYCRVEPNASPASDLKGQMVLILSRDLTEMPK